MKQCLYTKGDSSNVNHFVQRINTFVDEYKHFMGIEQFPSYVLQTKEVSYIMAELQGFDFVAQANYKVDIHQHTLCISTNLLLSKDVMFHEFTHMLDSEMYVRGDKVRYAGLSGYTEYHASQVQLAQLLGAKSINDIPSFKMDAIISTFAGEKTVAQYVFEKYQHAVDLFSRSDFPADLNTLKTAFGVLYNYWGYRSICEMYATDYEENINNSAFMKFIPTSQFVTINRLMHGWLDDVKIDLSILLYNAIIFPIIKQKRLM